MSDVVSYFVQTHVEPGYMIHAFSDREEAIAYARGEQERGWSAAVWYEGHVEGFIQREPIRPTDEWVAA